MLGREPFCKSATAFSKVVNRFSYVAIGNRRSIRRQQWMYYTILKTGIPLFPIITGAAVRWQGSMLSHQGYVPPKPEIFVFRILILTAVGKTLSQ